MSGSNSTIKTDYSQSTLPQDSGINFSDCSVSSPGSSPSETSQSETGITNSKGFNQSEETLFSSSPNSKIKTPTVLPTSPILSHSDQNVSKNQNTQSPDFNMFYAHYFPDQAMFMQQAANYQHPHQQSQPITPTQQSHHQQPLAQSVSQSTTKTSDSINSKKRKSESK